MALVEYLALEGGGAKGIIYIGVAEALQKLELLDGIKAISGASAGAISALVLATGWPVQKMKDTLESLDFQKMASGGVWGNLTAGYHEVKEFGLHNGQAFYELFKKIIKEVTGNENCTFEQWHKFKEEHPQLKLKDISVQACNLNTKLNETFAFNTEHRDVPIADAVRASMAFPGYFTPWKIKGCLYSDGGLQKNLPSDVFEQAPGQYNPKVLSVKLEAFDQIKFYDKGIIPPAKPIRNAFECAVAQFECALNAQDYVFQASPYKQSTVFCDTIDIGTLQFDLSPDQKEALAASGEYGVIRYFYKLDPTIVEGKYDTETLNALKAADFPICFSEFIKKYPVPPEIAQDVKVASQKEGAHGNVLEFHLPKRHVTPLFHRWCKNNALKAECDRLARLEAEHKHSKRTLKQAVTL
ncbi:MAG: patatin-like phospholipase family protein [Proteobacteria bacterium]|nr:patatin-like phospholipase family protein [Pseudomonadota bacterium]